MSNPATYINVDNPEAFFTHHNGDHLHMTMDDVTDGASCNRQRMVRKDVYNWIMENISGKWEMVDKGFCFDDDTDAMAFKLRWI